MIRVNVITNRENDTEPKVNNKADNVDYQILESTCLKIQQSTSDVKKGKPRRELVI